MPQFLINAIRSLKHSQNVKICLLFFPLLTLLIPQDSLNFAFSRAFFWLFPLVFFALFRPHIITIDKRFFHYLLLWLIFIGIAVFSNFSSSDKSLSLFALADLVAFFFYSLLFYLNIKSDNSLQLFTYLLIGSAFILSLLSFYFQFFDTNPIIPGTNLFYPNFGHNHLASILIYVLPLTITLLLKTKSTFLKLLLILLIGFFGLEFLLSFSRSAFLILPTIFALFLVYQAPKNYRAIFIAGIFLPLLLYLGIIFVSNTSLAKNITAIQTSPWLTRQLIKPLKSESRPLYAWQAVKGFIDHPLLGTGPHTFSLTSFKYRLNPSDYSSFAHNMPLEILSTLGILGLISFLSLLLFTLINVKSEFVKPQSPLMLTFAIIALGLFLHSLLDINLNFLFIQSIFWIVIALLFQTTKGVKVSLNFHLFIPLLGFLVFCSCLYVTTHYFINFRPKTTITESNLILFVTSEPDDLIKLFARSPNLILSRRSVALINYWHPNHPELLKTISKSFFVQENFPAALNFAQKSLNNDPSNPQLLQFYFYKFLAKEQYLPTLQFSLLFLRHNYFILNNIDINKVTAFNYLATRITFNTVSTPTIVKILPFNQQLNLDQNLFFAILFYNLGLDQLTTHPDQTLIYWQLASFLAPYWSYFHIDLANFYFNQSHPELALEQLQYCQKFNTATAHCQNYLNSYKSTGLFNPPGSELTSVLSILKLDPNDFAKK
jgi:O-antigen ligase